MKRASFAIAVVLTLFAVPTLAAEKTAFQISPRFGRGELRIDEFKGVNEELEELETFGLGASFGIVTPVGVMFALGHTSFGNFDVFNATDEFNLTELYFQIGYQFELGDGWRLVPKVGRTRWKLTSEDGQLFHPGPEDTEVLRGYEYFWEADLARRINKHMALGITVRGGDYDFGESRSIAFLMSFEF